MIQWTKLSATTHFKDSRLQFLIFNLIPSKKLTMTLPKNFWQCFEFCLKCLWNSSSLPENAFPLLFFFLKTNKNVSIFQSIKRQNWELSALIQSLSWKITLDRHIPCFAWVLLNASLKSKSLIKKNVGVTSGTWAVSRKDL